MTDKGRRGNGTRHGVETRHGAGASAAAPQWPKKRERRPGRSPADDALAAEWDRLKSTLAKFRDQDAADRIRQDLTVLLTAVERGVAPYALHSSGVPMNLVFDILQAEEDGEYKMQMPARPRSRVTRARPSENS